MFAVRSLPRQALLGSAIKLSCLLARRCPTPQFSHQFRIRPASYAGAQHSTIRAVSTSSNTHDLAKQLEGVNIEDLTKNLSKDTKLRLADALKAEGAEYDPFAESVPSAEEILHAPPVTRLQYIKLVVRTGAPFVVFGMIDNAIMIVAGETLDHTFGTTLGLSTMAAAAMGNMFSDVVGTGFGGIIQAMADKLRVPNPHLTSAQHHLPKVVAIKNISCVGGIAFGCILGMFPLLFT